MRQRMQGRVAVVTGGAGGIGRAAARALLDEGALVLLVDANRAALDDALHALQSERCDACVADVTQVADTRRFIDQARSRFGGVDVLLANAGIEGDIAAIPDYDDDRFAQVMAVNVTGVWMTLKYGIPALRERGGGSIVVTSSTAAIRGNWGMAPYTASKSAVVGLVRTAALECSAWNIRVNAVNPAPVETRMMRSLEAQRAAHNGTLSAEEMRQKLAAGIPLKRYGTPEEVAQVMLFLASDDSSYCTGGVYMVDGGISAGSL